MHPPLENDTIYENMVKTVFTTLLSPGLVWFFVFVLIGAAIYPVEKSLESFTLERTI